MVCLEMLRNQQTIIQTITKKTIQHLMPENNKIFIQNHQVITVHNNINININHRLKPSKNLRNRLKSGILKNMEDI